MPFKRNKELPLDIYIPFVQTLYRDETTLRMGIASHVLLPLLVYFKTYHPIYPAISLVLALIGGMRLYSMRKYNARPAPTTREEARRRENVYIVWGTMHGLALGMFCFVAIYLVFDEFAEVASICLAFATATAISGRNYGSPRMVMILVVALMMPISAGFLLRGDMFHVILGLLSIPFFFAIRRFADNVRDVLFSAIQEEKKANRLARRFDRALNTMSHGLIMLNPAGKVAVANAEAARIMEVGRPDALLGRTMRAVLMRGVAAGVLDFKECRYLEMQISRAFSEGRDRRLQVRLENGRHFELSARPGHDELGVITFEEVTARVETEERVRHMARYDSLTDLPNRAYFHEIVAELMAEGDRQRHCAVAIFDLDDFKNVNDTLGHSVGDGLILAVAAKLAAFASAEVKVSRFGGDEFMIFFNAVGDQDELGAALDRILAELQGNVDVAGHSLRVQVSAGAVLSRPDDTDVDAMIVKADLALYKAKEDGKNCWRMFESSMDAAFRNRQVMKAELRSAVEAEALRVVYQPIVSMRTMRVESCEALCRWDHPEMGAVSPGVFIPLAEEMGIIGQISTFMLNTACAQCARWPNEVAVSVNLSAKDFHSREIVGKVRDALARSGLAPHRLEIEVTETVLLDDKLHTHDVLVELKEMGVRIALDDFGTGYSSLSYLHTLPLDKVKIDRSFLMDVNRSERSLELLKGIVNLSRGLGLSITVEGVETFEQLKILASSVEPDLVQGFLFGSPLSASGIDTMSSVTWPFAEDLRLGSSSVSA